MKYENFKKFKQQVAGYTTISHIGGLLMKDFGEQKVYYAPFDYVNPNAKLMIVGLTPGKTQMDNMLVEARNLINSGLSDEEVLRQCKHIGSFSGPMRINLVRMLDYLGLNRYLGVESTASVFEDKSALVNLTSSICYPTFTVKATGEEVNFNGSVGSELMDFAKPYTLNEVNQAQNAIILPLGSHVYEYLNKVLAGTDAHKRLLPDIPHPSGANAERIAYFLGIKDKAQLSSRTNASKIDKKKDQLTKKLRELI